MYYSAELEYLCRVLKKMHVQVMRLDQADLQVQDIDLGLRKFLGREEAYERNFRESLDHAKENTIYKLTDELMCKYIFLLLPGHLKSVPLIAGPYMSFDMTRERLLEEAERQGVPAWRVPV